MENLIKRHKEKFGVAPVEIGMFWNDQEQLFDNIEKAIEDNKPYNEYKDLLEEDKKAYDKGELVF